MGWNGSGLNNEKTKAATSNRSRRCPLAICCLSAVISVVAFWTLYDSPQRDTKINATPDKSIVSENCDLPIEKWLTPAKCHYERVGNHRPFETESIKPAITNFQGKPEIPHRRVITNRTQTVRSKFDCFEHESEVQLAYLANHPVGNLVIGSVEYDEEFIKDLGQAFLEKIPIFDSDDEETIAIKNSVICLKNELQQMLKEGNDLAEVLSSTRSELRRLGEYKELLAGEIEDLVSNEETSDKDVEDFVNAANVLLEEKGIEPLYFSKFTKTILREKNRDYFSSMETTND